MKPRLRLLFNRLLTSVVFCFLLATASRGFASQTTWAIDLDQDGSLERISAEWDSSTLLLRLESGEIIAELEGLDHGELPRLCDVNGDGRPDLASDQRVILDGRELAGTSCRDIAGFEERWNTGDVLRNVWDSEVDDLDGDGAWEIVGQAYYYPGTLVRVFENVGDDSFTETWASEEQNTPSIVALGTGETDGDGQAEILAGVAGTLGTLYMWEDVGDDDYEARYLGFQMDWQVRDLHVGDTDEDGSMEFVGVGSSSTDGGSLKIFEHSGAVGENVYTNVYTYETVSYLLGCEIGDADNDGNLEMLLNVGGWAGFPTYIRRIEYNPDIGSWEHKLFEASTTGLPISAEIGDFDLDGDNELAIGSSGVIHIYESYLDDSFTPVWSSSFDIPGNVMDLTLGPIDEFGYPTLASCSFEGQVDIIAYDGGIYRRLMDTPLNTGDPLRSIDFGSFDGADALHDLVLARSGSDLVSVFEEINLAAVDWPHGSAGGLRLELAGNPFRTSTEIHLSSPRDAGSLSLRVYDLRGRFLRDLTGGLPSGIRHVVSWNGRDANGASLPAGVYLLRLRAGRLERAERIVILR